MANKRYGSYEMIQNLNLNFSKIMPDKPKTHRDINTTVVSVEGLKTTQKCVIFCRSLACTDQDCRCPQGRIRTSHGVSSSLWGCLCDRYRKKSGKIRIFHTSYCLYAKTYNMFIVTGSL